MKTKILAPSDPSTFKMTDEQWKEVCKKKEITSVEFMEAVRRNGVDHCWADDIYVSRVVEVKVDKKVGKNARQK